MELPGYEGYFIFIEKPSPGPDWIEKILKMLKEEGWEGKPFKDFRINCRGERERLTTVIDKKEDRVFHNQDMRKGSGKVENLNEFGD